MTSYFSATPSPQPSWHRSPMTTNGYYHHHGSPDGGTTGQASYPFPRYPYMSAQKPCYQQQAPVNELQQQQQPATQTYENPQQYFSGNPSPEKVEVNCKPFPQVTNSSFPPNAIPDPTQLAALHHHQNFDVAAAFMQKAPSYYPWMKTCSGERRRFVLTRLFMAPSSYFFAFSVGKG